MAQIPKGRLVKGPYEPICGDCAIYFSITVSFLFVFHVHSRGCRTMKERTFNLFSVLLCASVGEKKLQQYAIPNW